MSPANRLRKRAIRVGEREWKGRRGRWGDWPDGGEPTAAKKSAEAAANQNREEEIDGGGGMDRR